MEEDRSGGVGIVNFRALNQTLCYRGRRFVYVSLSPQILRNRNADLLYRGSFYRRTLCKIEKKRRKEESEKA
jgi:hypothetical protein